MAEDGRRQPTSLMTFTLSGLGLGAVISLVVGVVYGFAIDDMARGIGQGCTSA